MSTNMMFNLNKHVGWIRWINQQRGSAGRCHRRTSFWRNDAVVEATWSLQPVGGHLHRDMKDPCTSWLLGFLSQLDDGAVLDIYIYIYYELTVDANTTHGFHQPVTYDFPIHLMIGAMTRFDRPCNTRFATRDGCWWSFDSTMVFARSEIGIFAQCLFWCAFYSDCGSLVWIFW